MNDHETTRLLQRLAETYPEQPAPLTALLNAAQRGQRRKTRRTLTFAAASVGLVLGGGALVQHVVTADAHPSNPNVNPQTLDALRTYDPQAMPRLMSEHASDVFSRSSEGLPPAEFRAEGTSLEALPANRYSEAQSMEVLYRLPDQHELWFYIGHSRSHAEGNAERICAASLASGSNLECEVVKVGGDVAMVTVNASAAGWTGVDGPQIRLPRGHEEDRQVVLADDIDAVEPDELMFDRTVKVVHSETFLSVVRESVNAPDLATAENAFQFPIDDMLDLASDPTMVIPEPQGHDHL